MGMDRRTKKPSAVELPGTKSELGEIGGGVLYFVCLSAIEFLGADG